MLPKLWLIAATKFFWLPFSWVVGLDGDAHSLVVDGRAAATVSTSFRANSSRIPTSNLRKQSLVSKSPSVTVVVVVVDAKSGCG